MKGNGKDENLKQQERRMASIKIWENVTNTLLSPLGSSKLC